MSAGTLLFVTDVSPYRNAQGEPSIAGVHHSLGSAATALAQIAELCGLDFVHAPRAATLSPGDLGEARLLVLFTIGETAWSEEQRAVVERRAASGELGVAGLHSCTDAAYQWAAMGQLLGARFNGHPVTGDLPVTVVDRDHPATAHLPSPWRFQDELYLFRELVPDARILLAVNFGRDDAEPLPLAWCVERGPTRTFYTALGHFGAAYENVDYLQHVLGGIRWVLGPALAQHEAALAPARPAAAHSA